MAELLRHRGLKGLVQLRWLLPLLSAVLLLCFSGAGAQAHGISTLVQSVTSAAVSQSPSTGSVAMASQTREEAQAGDDHCPGGNGYVAHGACAGVSCHAAANGAGPATDFQPSHSDYERLAMTVGDGRIIAPLFHPPKI